MCTYSQYFSQLKFIEFSKASKFAKTSIAIINKRIQNSYSLLRKWDPFQIMSAGDRRVYLLWSRCVQGVLHPTRTHLQGWCTQTVCPCADVAPASPRPRRRPVVHRTSAALARQMLIDRFFVYCGIRWATEPKELYRGSLKLEATFAHLLSSHTGYTSL